MIRPERFYTRRGWQNAIAETHCFISGSDSIWNTYLGYYPELFLGFAPGSKKIAYSSSIGTDHVNPPYAERVRQHLLEFAHIGVRENAGVKALAALTGRTDIVRVLDPVFLLTKESWTKVLQQNPQRPACVARKPYILCYLLGKSTRYLSQVAEVVQHTGISEIVNMQAWENQEFEIPGVERIERYTPLQFLKLLVEADYVCTDSFHCCAFSVIFNKQFVAFSRFAADDPENSNYRVTDMLALFGLSNRLYDEKVSTWKREIDYGQANRMLTSEREKSLSYLISSIER